MIIALSGRAGCGKSTAAAYLVERHGFARVRFAGPLKAMLRAYLAEIGLGPEAIEALIEGDRKEKPSPVLAGRSPRYAMQHLGTAWGRELMGPDFWTRAWEEAVERAFERGALGVVAEDCRFENEAAAVRAVGGSVLRIERPGLPAIAGGHVSESGIKDAYAVLNDGSPDTLFARLDFVVRRIERAA
ncbi:hypothetical protein MCBMB27_02654 [Methylobacterium phyllosphaerae]|uniref:Deoxynucleotide monophosphate kinase n=1 Tax=Methylobacterium phyllosphaerae TaxID=418223 RepID=A0AAE8HSG4_9HYPH|nr:hypothetical protein [Methylobacterium phyllosphaerae]APT31945.1 hypothetical protein MCBMB27_02654 [Methylobacterium phyllosphaerae]SFH01120.1 hypothetical protein SAMN05192567_11213 [Methylobacterium phyllosphaerae]